MKLRLAIGACFLALLGTLIVLFGGRGGTAEAADAHKLLESALMQIEVPQRGQVAHYTYAVYRRPPPRDLEPGDPYHLPYEDIWPTQEFEDTWLEIGPDGKTVRWRTQLRSADGEVLQDLLFDGEMETDYFPGEGRAMRFPGEAAVFRDDRVALIEDFLTNQALSRRQNRGLNDEQVLSVYTPAKEMPETQDVDEALSNLTRPFIADLKPVSYANRIDFDPVTLLPVGEAQIMWDASGSEHVITYRAFSKPEILSASPQETEAIFRQEIPEQAFQDSFSASVQAEIVRGIPEITKQVDYPIYALTEGQSEPMAGLRLVAASLAQRDSATLPGFVQGIEFAATDGAGVVMTYANEGNTAGLTLIQGATAAMRDALRQTRPTWSRAERATLRLGEEQVNVWKLLSNAGDGRLRYVVEAGETILYLDSRGLQEEQISGFLQQLAPAE